MLNVLGTALTGIGGHFLNRRWDKAILFLSLFISYGLFCWIVLSRYLFSRLAATTGPGEEALTQFATLAKTTSTAYIAGTAVLWLASVVVTAVDGGKIQHTRAFQWTKTAMAAAALTTILSVILLGLSIRTSIATLKVQRAPAAMVAAENESGEAVAAYRSHNFFEHLYMGGVPKNSRGLPAPPRGDGLLVGRILYDKAPAADVSLSMVLNSKYRVTDIVTDSEGMFKVELPVGDWKINAIQTQSWQNKPNHEKFSLYYGGEGKLTGNRFDPHSGFHSDGHLVPIDKHADKVDLNLRIKKDITLIWPKAEQQGLNASIDDAIDWEPYPGAARYYVDIKLLKREGTTTYIEKVTSRVLAGKTRIPLNTLKHVETTAKKPSEYAAEIYAFADDGTLLGEFTDTFQGGTFVLTGGLVLIEDEIQEMFSAIDPEDSQKIQEKMESLSLDRRRIDAVKLLIDEGMLPEAERLLQLVHSAHVNGDKEVLGGYIHALNADCAKSREMFAQATRLYSNVCIPQKYRDVCGN